jgi:tetratricopeptide (TPR) repeat protein
MSRPARKQRKRSPPRAPRDPLLLAATILREAGVPAGRVPGTVRQLARLFGRDRNARAESPEAPPAGSTTQPKGRVLMRVRTETTISELGTRSPTRRMDEAREHFERGLALEESDMEAAREAYAAALGMHGEHLEARINLGRLMHLNGELEAAENVYRAARQGSAVLAYNLALVLEDLGRNEEAVAAYRESLAMDPTLHEAHLNLGLLYERQQCPREALRHMLAFRRSSPEP